MKIIALITMAVMVTNGLITPKATRSSEWGPLKCLTHFEIWERSEPYLGVISKVDSHSECEKSGIYHTMDLEPSVVRAFDDLAWFNFRNEHNKVCFKIITKQFLDRMPQSIKHCNFRNTALRKKPWPASGSLERT